MPFDCDDTARLDSDVLSRAAVWEIGILDNQVEAHLVVPLVVNGGVKTCHGAELKSATVAPA